jgi:hypothetical protein
VDHIARHGVTPEEFEQVCFGLPFVLRAKATGQNPVCYLLGETDAGRPLLCVVIEFPGSKAYPVTARDMTDFEDELEEVPDPVFQRAHVVGVPLTGDEHQAVRDAAASRGIDEAALIHEWVKERLHHA